MRIFTKFEVKTKHESALKWLNSEENVYSWKPNDLSWDSDLKCFIPFKIDPKNFDNDALLELLVCQDLGYDIAREESIQTDDDLEDSELVELHIPCVNYSQRSIKENKAEEKNVQQRSNKRKRSRYVFEEDNDVEDVQPKQKRSLYVSGAETALTHLGCIRIAINSLRAYNNTCREDIMKIDESVCELEKSLNKLCAISRC